ncbi:AbrB family transcriptional regulator [Pseudoneobacillus sp. C159]
MKNWRLPTGNKQIQFLGTLVIAIAGGFLFHIIGLPIPWLLGSMTAILVASRFPFIDFLFWPKWVRDIGLIIVGYSIGLSFTRGSLLQMVTYLPSMFLFIFFSLLIGAGMAFFIYKLSGVDFPTLLTGSIPGGLSQIITFAEETKEIDITTVTFFQVTRMLMIVFSVPLIIFSPFFYNGDMPEVSEKLLKTIPTEEFSVPLLGLFLFSSYLFARTGKKIKLPTAYLLGPMIGIAIINISGITGPQLPSSLLIISQLMIGGYIGLLLKPEKLEHKSKIITFAILNALVMVIASFGLSFLLVKFHHFSPVTAFLCLAPGGMDQLSMIAHETTADLSIVSSFQLFRVFFIYFAIPPLLKWLLKWRAQKKQNQLADKVI